MWSRTGLVSEGIIGGASLWTRQILLNRQIPALHTAYATILGTNDLLVNHDRYGMFRPAKEHCDRRTMTNLHLDMNPWNYIDGLLIGYFSSSIHSNYFFKIRIIPVNWKFSQD